MQYRAEQHGMAFPSQDAPTRRLAGSGLKHVAALQTTPQGLRVMPQARIVSNSTGGYGSRVRVLHTRPGTTTQKPSDD
jgi:hypothetical protein